MKRNAWNRRGITLALAATLSALVGCGDDDETPPDPTPSTQAKLRVVHASPDAPAVDIYAEGNSTPLFTNVRYGDTTSYATVPTGTYNVQVRAAGSAATSAPVYSTGPLTLTKDQSVSAVAAGLLTATDSASGFRVLPLTEGFGAPAEGRARVRIVHAGADAPTVALDVGDDGSSEITSLARFQDTGAAGVELPSGQSLQVGVRTTDNQKVTSFTVPALPSRGEVFVIATGRLSEKAHAPAGFGLLAAGVGLVRQNPVVYALHASPDAPSVDVFVGNAELVDDLNFGELSAPIQVPPGSYTLDFFASASGSTRPSGAPAASRPTPALVAGERYLVLASGFLSPAADDPADSTFELLAFTEGFTPDTDSLRLRVVHASPDAPVVDVSPVENGVVPASAAFDDLPYRLATSVEGRELPGAQLLVGVAAANSADRSPVARFQLDTSAFLGRGVFAVAAGALSPSTGSEAALRLVLVDTSTTPWSALNVHPQP
ncbi:DUF4397 domain-containing protein [Myxococcus sp. XM-1-1-1]|uniref:DUF4397 domain-containing protein n=1 Tax=Myxococcus sp. XM-1-1-1 TaxID=2874602 RepID=UPI001CBC9FD0|nr:DUF4397 domain-containing protein [Myxococcus sp. XM-1-1-1]MBZ4413868.1 DUF4397 domain-containing protein [Myxococcus sp. XM-1-1-1]